jgi:hypothetical protein
LGVEVQLSALITLVQDGSEWSALHSAALPLGKGSLVATEEEAGWAPEPILSQQRQDENLSLVGIISLMSSL